MKPLRPHVLQLPPSPGGRQKNISPFLFSPFHFHARCATSYIRVCMPLDGNVHTLKRRSECVSLFFGECASLVYACVTFLSLSIQLHPFNGLPLTSIC